MSNIEQELKKIGQETVLPMDLKFSRSLRRYILNEYSEILEKKSITSLIANRISIFWSGFVNILKLQSSLSFATIFLSFLTIGTVASYVAMPSSVKDKVRRAFTNEIAVQVSSNVDGAEIFVNGEYVGLSPLSMDLKEGNYALRVEKDGYVVYTDSLEVQKDEDETEQKYAQLIKLPEDSPYAGWLNYNNKDIGVSFMYPSNWKISEEIDETGENFSIVLAEDGNSMQLTYNSDSGLNLDPNDTITSFRRDLTIASQSIPRYLQFDENKQLINGGIEISAETHPPILIKYNISGSESDVLSSATLLSMDRIIESMSVGESEYVIAEVPKDEILNEVIDINEVIGEDEDEDEDEDEEATEPTENPVVLSQWYTNEVYGYVVGYPNDWSISTGRADYPDSEKAEVIRVGSNVYSIARLKLYSRVSGSIYFQMSYADVPIFEDDSNICKTYDGSRILTSFNGYSLMRAVDPEESDHVYQLCRNGNGVFNLKTANGLVKYSVFWDIDPESVDKTAIQDFEAIVKSFRYSGTTPDPVPTFQTYTNTTLGIKLKYPNIWKLIPVECDDSSKCGRINFVNSTGDKVISFSDSGYNIDNSGYLKKSRDIGGYSFDTYYSQICNETGCVDQFEYAEYKTENFNVIYFIEDMENIDQVLRSLENL